MGPLWLREVADGPGLADRALTVARERALAGVLPFLLGHVAVDRAARDRWPEAEAGFHEAIAISRESGQDAELAVALARLAWLEARKGKEEGCRAHATEALELSSRLGFWPCQVWCLAALGDLEFGLGRLEAARSCYEQQLAVLRERGIDDVDLSPAPELVEVYLRTGRAEQAAATAAAFAKDAAVKRLPWVAARGAGSWPCRSRR